MDEQKDTVDGWAEWTAEEARKFQKKLRYIGIEENPVNGTDRDDQSLRKG